LVAFFQYMVASPSPPISPARCPLPIFFSCQCRSSVPADFQLQRAPSSANYNNFFSGPFYPSDQLPSAPAIISLKLTLWLVTWPRIVYEFFPPAVLGRPDPAGIQIFFGFRPSRFLPPLGCSGLSRSLRRFNRAEACLRFPPQSSAAAKPRFFFVNSFCSSRRMTPPPPFLGTFKPQTIS